MNEENLNQPLKDTTQSPGSIDPAHSLAMLNTVMTKTMAMCMHNAVTAQQNAQVLNSALISAICTRIVSARKQKPILTAPPVPTAGAGPAAKTNDTGSAEPASKNVKSTPAKKAAAEG